MNGLKVQVYSLPIAANICDQMLREVERNDQWSMAHVLMNPGASSLLHKHNKMAEIYVITRGHGKLVAGGKIHHVQAGMVFFIPPGAPHQFFNTGATSLEHLVLAEPPFDPSDVVVIEDDDATQTVVSASLPEAEECFDGAKIISYEIPERDLSFAFGWVINDPARRKEPHYHMHTTEWLYIVEGNGFVEIDRVPQPVNAGDWVWIEAGQYHAIRNREDQYLVALCICSPRFNMEDVHYK